MITKQGYVFIAEMENFKPLFGEPKYVSASYENIESNDFSFFQEKNKLKRAITEFKKINHSKITQAELEMKIAESQQEADQFTNNNLIIIYDMSDRSADKIVYLQKRLYGPVIKDSSAEFNGICSRLVHNNFRTFNELGDIFKPGTAKYVAKEAHRQGDNAPVTIAKFKLEFLDKN